jgi:hypothetical protein
MAASKAGDDSSTVLTDMMFKRDSTSGRQTPVKPPKSGPTKPNLSAKGGRNRADTDLKRGDFHPEEKESAIDSDEYQDMVFDIEYGKALMDKADNFL